MAEVHIQLRLDVRQLQPPACHDNLVAQLLLQLARSNIFVAIECGN